MRLRALAWDVACLGPLEALRKARAGFRGADLIVLRKALGEIEPIALERRLEVAEVRGADLAGLDALNRRHCNRRATGRFAADLAHGRRGFVARRGGEIAGHYWWADDDHPHLDRLGITLAEGDVYGFDFFLAPEHRGDGHAVEFLFEVETRLRALGYARLWGYVRSDNRPARWLYSLRGYESVGSAHGRMS